MKFENLRECLTEVVQREDLIRIIDHFREDSVSVRDVAELTKAIAFSGSVVSRPSGEDWIDFASTGGPSSLSTLLCPLFCAAAGLKVVSLGIPGRPAGGVDVLNQLSGYTIHYPIQLLNSLLKGAQYVHFLADEDFTPLDKRLFELRREIGAVSFPGLVIASILGKKLASGVNFLGLDIRVFESGNFGKNSPEAMENARLFISVAELLGIHCVCILTDGSIAHQPYVGRGEAILALHELFYGEPSRMLDKHFLLCGQMASAASPSTFQIPSKLDVQKAFEANLEDQHSSKAEVVTIANDVKRKQSHRLLAQERGHVHIDLTGLRECILEFQNDYCRVGSEFTDGCGVVLHKQCGDWVEQDETVATYRIESQQTEKAAKKLSASFKIVSKPMHIPRTLGVIYG